MRGSCERSLSFPLVSILVCGGRSSVSARCGMCQLGIVKLASGVKRCDNYNVFSGGLAVTRVRQLAQCLKLLNHSAKKTTFSHQKLPIQLPPQYLQMQLSR